ncbi:MAG: PAS domain-containing protein [Syntrophales bacterium]|nr:PAS domain-containing protein [Syntrophales bacterium]
MIFSAVLQGMAVLLQLAAAFFAVRLIRITGWKISWLMVSGALCVMSVRRVYSLWLLPAPGAQSSLPFDGIFALLISLLMLGGMITVTHLFRGIKGSAAAALDAEHHRLYALLDALPALVYLKAPDYTIRFANRRFRDDFGDPEGKHCYNIFGANEVCPQCVALKVLENGAPIREEWVRPLGDRIYEFSHYPCSDLDNSPLVMTLGLDITARKHMEEVLRQNEENYRLLVNQIPAVVFKGYADWSVDFFDNKIEDLTGYCKEEFDSRRLKWSAVILPEDLDYAKNIFLEALKGNDSYVREHRIRRKDGEIRWVQCWGRIFRDAAGKIDHISGVTFDVTPRKEMEEALRQSEASLQHLTSQLLTVQEKERARIARELHDDLGQSLMVMKMRLRSMHRLVLAANQINAGEIKELVDGLDGMVGNVRRISQDLCPYFLVDLGLEVALRRLLEEFSKHCRISLQLDGDLTGLDQLIPTGNQIHIYRIFQECLTNIARHSGASAFRVAISKKKEMVSFFLEDNGRGFDVDSFRKATAKSGSIGLAALKERARLLAGDLSISSKPGKGTKINLVIPGRSKD